MPQTLASASATALTRQARRPKVGDDRLVAQREALPGELLELGAVDPGDAVLSPSITRRVIADHTRRPPAREGPEELSDLTPRELDVLRPIAGGMSNAEIARTLVVGDATVKMHITRIFAKLRVHDRAHAVVLAYESGFVQPGAGRA